jgi:putative tricarboxylic transport membrane protein
MFDKAGTRWNRVRELLPYGIVLGAAVYFYYLADHFSYAAIPDRIGPDGWPKLVLVLLGLVCVYEIMRRVLVKSVASEPAAELLGAPAIGQDEDMEAAGPGRPGLVAAAVALTVGYLLVIETTGFFLSTFAYLAVLMGIGGFRRIAVVLPLALALALFFMYVFMKIIFVALPIGIEPFSRVSVSIMSLLGVH